MTSAFVVASVDPTRSESVLSNSLSKSMVYLGMLKSYCVFTAQRKTRGNHGKDACSNRFSYPDFLNALLISNSTRPTMVLSKLESAATAAGVEFIDENSSGAGVRFQ